VIDYLKVCDCASLQDADLIDDNAVMLVAVKIGSTRLIDNHLLTHPWAGP